MREKVVVSSEWRERRLDWVGGGSHSAVQRMALTAEITVTACLKVMAETAKLATAVNQEFNTSVLFQVIMFPAGLQGGIILVGLSSLGCSDRVRYIWSMIKYNSIP